MKENKVYRHIKKNYQLYLMILPALIIILLFNYVPMYGLQLAFRKFDSTKGLTGGASYSNFSHFSKKYSGYNFTGYLEKLRITKAKEYLEDPYQSIECIAVKVGYNCANSLSRAFKKSEGITPGEYRKSIMVKKEDGIQDNMKN